MKSIKNIGLMSLLGVALLQTSCEKSEIISYKDAIVDYANSIGKEVKGGVNFSTLKTEYSFLGNPDETYIVKVPVKIIGNVSGIDRTFKVEVVEDENTTANSNQYRVIGGFVKANSFDGELEIEVKNSIELKNTVASLNLQITESSDFYPGNIETTKTIVTWTNQVVLPPYTALYRGYFCNPLSYKAYEIIVQTTGLKTLTQADLRAMGQAQVEYYATVFGDYVKQWNLDHPDDKIKHDSGTASQIGKEIAPLYYTKSKYN